MPYAESFVAPLTSCNESLAAGSAVYVGLLQNCADEPIEYLLTAAAAVAAGGTSVSLQITSATQDGVAVTPVPDTLLLREGLRLSFGASNYVIVRTATEINSTSTTVVPIEAAVNAAVSANGTTTTWALGELLGVTELPLDIAGSEGDLTTLKAGIQQSAGKTGVALSINLSYFSRPTNKAQRAIITKAALSTQDIYVVIVNNDGKTAFGRAIVMNESQSVSVTSFITVSATLNIQPPFAVTYLDADPSVNSVAQLAELNKVLRLTGIAPVA